MDIRTHAQPLSSTQMMLLRLFSQPIQDERMKELKKLLLDFYTQKLHEEVDKAIAYKSITDEDIDAVLYRQQRTR
ncbi:MAG: hypothetical protein RLZZ292_3462 [Bacteroidota bacterium]|jgi:hypothetical protein